MGELIVQAGCMMLPESLKMANLMSKRGLRLPDGAAPLQIEANLGRDFQYHSVFVCPVSREQSTPDNPPVQLPCGHVVCRLSMMQLVRANSRFKCPYCPTDVHLEQVKYISFF